MNDFVFLDGYETKARRKNDLKFCADALSRKPRLLVQSFTDSRRTGKMSTDHSAQHLSRGRVFGGAVKIFEMLIDNMKYVYEIKITRQITTMCVKTFKTGETNLY